MTTSVGMHEAKTHLSRLVQLIDAGEEVVITRRGVVVARLVPPEGRPTPQMGFNQGRFEVPDDFDAPLPDTVLEMFEA